MKPPIRSLPIPPVGGLAPETEQRYPPDPRRVRTGPINRGASTFVREAPAASRWPKLLPRAIGLPWLLFGDMPWDAPKGDGTITQENWVRREYQDARRPAVLQVEPRRAQPGVMRDVLLYPSVVEPVVTRPGPMRLGDLVAALEPALTPRARADVGSLTLPLRRQVFEAARLERFANGLVNPVAIPGRPAQIAIVLQATQSGLRFQKRLEPVRPDKSRYKERKSKLDKWLVAAIHAYDAASEAVDVWDAFAANLTSNGVPFERMSWEGALQALREGRLTLDVTGFIIDLVAENLKDMAYGVGPHGVAYGTKTIGEKISGLENLNGILSEQPGARETVAGLIGSAQKRVRDLARPLVWRIDL